MSSSPPQPPNLLNLYNLGCHYMESCDYAKALSHFSTAASYGHPLSCHNLAVMQSQGLGCAINNEEAIKNFKTAAERRFPESQYSLAILLKNHHHDIETAKELLESAASQGHVAAAYSLGVLESGDVDGGDKEAAVKYYRQAAEGGHVKAAVNLGVVLGGGGEGEGWLKAAADAGDVNAAFNLSVKYRGEGKDREAVEMMEKASVGGHVGATFNLAKCYAEGMGGVEKDLEKAMGLMDKAADEGDDRAAKAARKLSKIRRNERIESEKEEREKELKRLEELKVKKVEVEKEEEEEEDEEEGYGERRNTRGKPTNQAIERVKAAVAKRKAEAAAKKKRAEMGEH